MQCLCLALPTLDILCCVLCGVHAYAKLCVAGGHICLCMRKPSGFYEWMCQGPPPPHTLVICYLWSTNSTCIG